MCVRLTLAAHRLFVLQGNRGTSGDVADSAGLQPEFVYSCSSDGTV